MEAYRLALDIGTNSIGWCALRLSARDKKLAPSGILDMGVRIFSDGRHPKTGLSNAVKRRMARSIRRNRDRFLERRNRLLDTLVDIGLMPKDQNARQSLILQDPYLLRTRGLDERLELYEFGRAIFHLNQRRGFKSNRKSDTEEKETGALKKAISMQGENMAAMGARTFGEFLFLRRESKLSVRSRMMTRPPEDPNSRKKAEDYYDFYPARADIEAEFESLWRTQSQYHADELNEVARFRVHNCIFDQRPLKSPVVGRCALEPGDERLAWAFPLAQQLRIYQELNNLGLIDPETLTRRDLTLDERDLLAEILCKPKGLKNLKKAASKVTFDQMRTALKRLGLAPDTTFTFESEKRDGLEGDTTSALLSHSTRFGSRWYALTDADRENIVAMLIAESDEELLLQMLQEDWELDREHAQNVSNTTLPRSHGRRGRTAAEKIVAELKAAIIPESEAVIRAGYPPQSSTSHGKAHDRLPYYGEVLERHVVQDPEKAGHPAAKLEQKFGKVSNPTVHIALNQVRKVVNDIIKLHGKPVEIHVEVLRELKNSVLKRKEIEKEQAENQRRNDKCADRLRNEFHERVTRENIQRVRLWQELGEDKCICVYTGEKISAQRLFTAEVEIDHILPWSRTLDDGTANKVLCMRRANRDKSDRTPCEAWGNTAVWEELLARTTLLPQNKQWRFAEDALERFLKENDFLKRQLTDSQYIASLARGYLAVLFEPDKSHKVVCLPGRLTGMFRHKLGLGSLLEEINPALRESPLPKGEKNRNDHRHHAVDALLVGLMDRAFLQRAATICARHEGEGVYEFLAGFEEPWEDFRAEAREALRKIIVSHKLDHGIEGELHNQTAYGFAKNNPRGEAFRRKPIRGKKPNESFSAGDIPMIKGRHLQAELVAHLSGLSYRDVLKKLLECDDSSENARSGMAAKVLALSDPNRRGEEDVLERARDFFDNRGIRRVRILERIHNLVEIVDRRSGAVFKRFKPDSNAYLDIFEIRDGHTWRHEITSTFCANTTTRGDSGVAANYSGDSDKPVTRLFNRDMLEMEHNGARRVFCIQRISDSQITLAEHFEAGADGRNRNKSDPFRFVYKGSAEALRKAKVRFLTVTPAGRIRFTSGIYNDSESG